jgi:hypothetical protein
MGFSIAFNHHDNIFLAYPRFSSSPVGTGFGRKVLSQTAHVATFDLMQESAQRI